MTDDGCVLCGLMVQSCLTNAHIHKEFSEDAKRTFRLCWSCHRMYDHDIISTQEVIEAENDWALGVWPDATAFHRQIETELESGERRVDKSRQHKFGARKAGKKIKSKNAGRKAAKTRKENLLRAQATLAPLKRDGESIVDEFLAEKRSSSREG